MSTRSCSGNAVVSRPGRRRDGSLSFARSCVSSICRGFTPLRLGTAVPPVGGWRLAALPPTMTAADVQLLLDSCDRSSDVGVRDFAIMTLVARLGLRSIEVARLALRDVDGRAGELVVRGKARRQDRLPLPAEAGEAMAAYLAWGRTPAGARRLFLTCHAPR